MEYDVFQVEDVDYRRGLLRSSLGKLSLSYFGVGSLEELGKVLSNDLHARIYLLDVHFPKKPGGKEELLVYKAAEFIRAHDSNAKIILYTCDDRTRLREDADKFDWLFISKDCYYTSAQIAERLKQELDSLT